MKNATVCNLIFLLLVFNPNGTANTLKLIDYKNIAVQEVEQAPPACGKRLRLTASPSTKLRALKDGYYEFTVSLENVGPAAQACLSTFYEIGLPKISIELKNLRGDPLYRRIEAHMKPGDKMYQEFTFPENTSVELHQALRPEQALRVGENYIVNWRLEINGEEKTGSSRATIK